MTVLMRAPVVGTPIVGLMPCAFAISAARMVTVSDQLYVTLAEKHDIPLITADEKLIRRLSSDLALAKRMVWVADISA